MFRYANRHDGAFRDAFARGYAEASSAPLPDDWLLSARLLDSTWLVDLLDDATEIPVVFDDCRRLLVRLVDELG
jgi:hypothetical protein